MSWFQRASSKLHGPISFFSLLKKLFVDICCGNFRSRTFGLFNIIARLCAILRSQRQIVENTFKFTYIIRLAFFIVFWSLKFNNCSLFNRGGCYNLPYLCWKQKWKSFSLAPYCLMKIIDIILANNSHSLMQRSL